jgi:hypothetical protein
MESSFIPELLGIKEGVNWMTVKRMSFKWNQYEAS